MTATKNTYESVSEHPTNSAFVSKAMADQGVVRDQLFTGGRVLTTHSKDTDYDLESTRLALELESYMTGYAEALATEYNILEAPEDLDFVIVSNEGQVALFFADNEDRFNAEIRLSSTYLPGVDQTPALAVGWVDRATKEKPESLPLSSFAAFQKNVGHPHPTHISDFVLDIQDMVASYRCFAEAGRLSTHCERLKLSVDGIFPVDADYGIGSENLLPSSEFAEMEAAAPGAEHAYLNLRGPQTYRIDGRLHPDDNPNDPYASRLNVEECILQWGLPVSVYANGKVVLDPTGPTDPRSDAGHRAFLIEHYREVLERSGAELHVEILAAQERYRQYGQNAARKVLDIKWDRSEDFTVNAKMTTPLSDVLHDAGFIPKKTVDGRSWSPFYGAANHEDLHHGLAKAGWRVTHSGQVPDAMKAVLPSKRVTPPSRPTLSTPAERRQAEQSGRRIGR